MQDACVSRQTGWSDIVPLWITGRNNWVWFWTKNSIRIRVHFPCQGEQDSLRRQIARYANDEFVLYSLYGQNHLFRKNSISIQSIAFGIKSHASWQIKREAQTCGYIQICTIDRKLTQWEYCLIGRDLDIYDGLNIIDLAIVKNVEKYIYIYLW